MRETVDGKNIRIHFDGERCIHSRNCVLTLPAVFQANVEGPWINPDAATADEIAALARRCPSGAISYERLDGGPNEVPNGRNVVAVGENGPYAVRGYLRLKGEPAGTRLTLCRCGDSKSKPYCDHSHVDKGFAATGELPAAAELPAWPEGAPLAIDPIPNGPLKVAGPMEITSGSGRAAKRCSQAFLCRCGASSNKPYCDGTHRSIGFSAE